MLKKIVNKGMWVLNLIIGRLHLAVEKVGMVKPIFFSTFKKIKNRVLVSHQYPVNFSEKDKPLFSHYTNYQSANEEVFELNNIYVSQEGVVFSACNNFQYAFPHVVFRSSYGWLYIAGQFLFKKNKKLPDSRTYVLIYDFWSAANYYHWLIDTLPRLWIVKDELALDNYSLLLPAHCPKFIQATLTYFNIKNTIAIDKTEFVHAGKLLVPHYLAGSGHIHPVKVFEIKKYLVEKITGGAGEKLIYVSRGKQKARRVINEEEVINCLLPLGFKVVYFEEHSFEEQVNIGKNAEVMITSHGANLTNSLFMPQNSKVLELIREDKPNFCYWGLCNAARVNYHYQLCKIIGNDHLIVDIELFKLNLHNFLHAPAAH